MLKSSMHFFVQRKSWRQLVLTDEHNDSLFFDINLHDVVNPLPNKHDGYKDAPRIAPPREGFSQDCKDAGSLLLPSDEFLKNFAHGRTSDKLTRQSRAACTDSATTSIVQAGGEWETQSKAAGTRAKQVEMSGSLSESCELSLESSAAELDSGFATSLFTNDRGGLEFPSISYSRRACKKPGKLTPSL